MPRNVRDGEHRQLIATTLRRSGSAFRRALLDEHFEEWQPLRALARPPRGWRRTHSAATSSTCLYRVGR
ncbi:MAG TPA: hypothetical protein VMV07_04185 [Streptosporangiaceae bacterium]|nr:hypothetical protein [Streptosporangiaceae bacterium]